MQLTHPAFIEPFDLYMFGKGEHWDLYRVLGAHPVAQQRRKLRRHPPDELHRTGAVLQERTETAADRLERFHAMFFHGVQYILCCTFCGRTLGSSR